MVVERLFKQNIYDVIGKVILLILGIIFSVLMARLLHAHLFGVFSVLLAVLMFSKTMADLGLNNTIIRFFGDSYHRKKRDLTAFYLRYLLKLKLALTIIVTLVLLALSKFLAVWLLRDVSYAYLFDVVALGVMLLAFFDFFDLFFAAANKYQYSLLGSILRTVLKLVFCVGLVLAGYGLLGAIFGLLIAYIILFLIVLIIFLKVFRKFLTLKRKPKVSTQPLKGFFYCMALITMMSAIYVTVDVLLLSIMRTPAEVSYYKLPLTLVTAATIALPISTRFLFSAFIEIKKRVKLAYTTSMKYGFIVTIPAVAGTYLFASKIITLLYSTEYSAAVLPLQILAFSIVFMFVEATTMNLFFTLNEQKKFALIVFGMTIICVVLNLLLIPIYGAAGAAMAYVAMHVFGAVVSFVYAHVHFDIKAYQFILKPVIASTIMFLCLMPLMPYVHSILTAAGVAIVGVLIYLVAQILIKGLQKDDLIFIKRGISRSK